MIYIWTVLMMKKRLLTVFFCGLCLFGLAGLCLCASQAALSGRLIRFHVVANSDSAADQARKLQVRDRLLDALQPISAAGRTREETVQMLQAEMKDLQRIAEDTLRETGCTDRVSVRLTQESFPTRYYDTFTLPAGDYLSLRVTIGEGNGHNWWCVCFPALCTAATAEDFAAAAASAGFTEDEIAWVQEGSGEYELRFRILDWLQTVRSLLREDQS